MLHGEKVEQMVAAVTIATVAKMPSPQAVLLRKQEPRVTNETLLGSGPLLSQGNR
jgi:hypothetical protein